MAKFFFQRNIYLNKDVSKGLMEMREKRMWRERDAMNSRLQKISRIGGRILEAAEIVMRAVLFVVIVLALELACVGLVYIMCERW